MEDSCKLVDDSPYTLLHICAESCNVSLELDAYLGVGLIDVKYIYRGGNSISFRNYKIEQSCPHVNPVAVGVPAYL